jgi:hypothetical protein
MTELAPYEYETIEIVCDRLFKPTSLYLDHRSAHLVHVSSIVAGRDIVLPASGNVPGDVFCERRRKLSLALSYPTLQPGEKLSIKIISYQSSPIRVASFFVGVDTL